MTAYGYARVSADGQTRRSTGQANSGQSNTPIQKTSPEIFAGPQGPLRLSLRISPHAAPALVERHPKGAGAFSRIERAERGDDTCRTGSSSCLRCQVPVENVPSAHSSAGHSYFLPAFRSVLPTQPSPLTALHAGC
jgi:hypothetical protein